MKKLLFAFAVVALASCAGGSTETKTTDSTSVASDTTVSVDTTAVKSDTVVVK